LTEEERELAVWRLQEDIGVDDWVDSKSQTFWGGFSLAIKDIKVWILMFMLLGIVSAGSFTNFFPSVVKTLNYDNITTLLLTVPPYALAVITVFLNAVHADKTGERTLHIVLPLIVALAAFILAMATTSTGPRYAAMVLMVSTTPLPHNLFVTTLTKHLQVPSVYTSYVIVLAWISNTIARPPAKRAVALALINAVSNASQIYAAYMYSGGPRYILAFSVNCGTILLSIALAVVLRIMLARANRKLDRGEEVRNATNAEMQGEAMRKGFRSLI
jgi:hypothetical protein